MKIEEGYWYVSYDNGGTWTQLGKATGGSGESIFLEVTQDDDYVYFTLDNGEKFTLPKRCALDIVFEAAGELVCLPGESLEIKYTVTGGDDRTKVECLADRGWTAEVSGGTEGTLTVTAPGNGMNGKVLVFATNGAGQVVMKAVTIIQHADYIVFADPLVKEICVREFDTNGDGEISYDEAAAVTTNGMVDVFDRTDIVSFDELQYFTGLDFVAYMFDSCSYLQSVVLPPQINSVGSFSYSALRNIEIPEGVYDVTSYAFSFSKNLESVVLNSDLVEILWDAFEGCSSLKSIDLPETLIVMGESAFEDCSSLTTVYCRAIEPPQLTGRGNWFKGCPLETLYVPVGSKEKYEAAEGWSDFPNIVEMDFSTNN